MDMTAYLCEIRHAVESLIPIIWSEHKAEAEAVEQLKMLQATTENAYRRVAFIMDNDLDDDGIGNGLYWDTYFGVDKQRYHASERIEALEAVRDARSFSRAVLSAALLQIAKQGLSQVHGRLTSVPTSRRVFGVDIKDLIWQGRNHALHWEEGKPSPSVVDCFNAMASYDPAFANYKATNLAFQVVAALGWLDWTNFELDMVSLS